MFSDLYGFAVGKVRGGTSHGLTKSIGRVSDHDGPTVDSPPAGQ